MQELVTIRRQLPVLTHKNKLEVGRGPVRPFDVSVGRGVKRVKTELRVVEIHRR